MYLELVPGKLKMAHLNGIVWRSFQQSFDKHGWNYGNSLSVFASFVACRKTHT